MTDAPAADWGSGSSFEVLLAAYQSGERQTLLPRLAQAIRCGPADPRMLHLHGVVLREMDRREEALASLRSAAQLAPGSADIAHALARTLLETGLPSAEAFRHLLKLTRPNEEIVAGLASALIADGDSRTALKWVEDILRGTPQWVGGHVLLSRLRWMQGDRDGFTRSFDEALAELPQNLDLRREQLIALIHADRFDQALAAIAQGRAAMGEHPLFAANEAIVRAEMGEIETAERLFTPFVDLADPTIQVRRVRMFLRSARPDFATAVIEPWLAGPHAFVFWPYASLAWRQVDASRWQWLEGDQSFVGVYDIADHLPPLGTVAATLRKLHARSGQPLEQSLRRGTQTEGNLFHHIDPAIVQLREAIRKTVAEHVAKFPVSDPAHPLLGPRRDEITFPAAWSVRLQSNGYHANHVHPTGWISSALYIVLPPDSGAGEAGILTLGEAKAPNFPLDLPAYRTIEPKPGRLVLFPSYSWHGTRPFGEGERMTVAFDVARA